MWSMECTGLRGRAGRVVWRGEPNGAWVQRRSNAQRNRLVLERQRKIQSALTLWLGSYS